MLECSGEVFFPQVLLLSDVPGPVLEFDDPGSTWLVGNIYVVKNAIDMTGLHYSSSCSCIFFRQVEGKLQHSDYVPS